MITIDVFSDPICPWCYIGKKRLDQALAARPDLPIAVRWRAFQLNPDMPRDGMDRQSYLSAKVGIDFQFDKIPRTPSTLNAHRLIRYAQRPGVEKADGLMPALFQAYFIDGKDIGDVAVLLDIAQAVGLDRPAVQEYLNSREDEDEVQAEDVFARRLGIGGVPCFIIDGKYALSGAQEPEAFLPLLDMAVQEQTAGQSSVEG